MHVPDPNRRVKAEHRLAAALGLGLAFGLLLAVDGIWRHEWAELVDGLALIAIIGCALTFLQQMKR